MSGTGNAPPEDSLQSLKEALANTSLPPVHLWNPTQCRSIDMRIARNGEWFYNGSVIARKRMVKLFSTVLRADNDGHTYLVTPHEKLRIVVEDAPFTAVLLKKEGKGKNAGLVFTLNTGQSVLAGAHNPISVEYKTPGGEPSPYVLVRDNLRALVSRSVFIELAQIAQPVNGVLGVYSDGHFMPLAES